MSETENLKSKLKMSSLSFSVWVRAGADPGIVVRGGTNLIYFIFFSEKPN